MYDDEVCGQWGWSRQPVGLDELDELRCLLLACQPVVLSEGSDRLMWSIDKENGFSVRSMKSEIEDLGNTGVNFVLEWNNWVPKKVVIHAWRVEMERIPVMVQLVKRGVMVTSAICPISEEDLESAEHLVVSCQFAQSVWCIISSWCKISPFFAFSVKDLSECHRFYQLLKRKAKAFNAVCLTMVWCLWQNALVY
ncbi:uncharacterized protein LOC143609645 [Bidens hawaiensis]|uniref:uncharacterized protein LOC143609645 n=1 Tax=Bidens hawaiensis TaxID=980011 RepID=UPI00404AD30D